jgi:osmotically-inducible protein OsmY
MKSTTHTVVLLIRGIHAPSSTLKEIETDKIDTVLHDMADRFIDGQHPEVGTRVGVQTISHVVYLSGIASDPSVIITAANLAEQVKGVSRVENTIVVSQ